MDECFRFVVNVNQCLNMGTFDMFFYKLVSENKFRLNQVQLHDGHEADEVSFRHAIQDIRMYLNKHPYHFKEYQMIVTMRCAWEDLTGEWKKTLLFLLMRISHELRSQNIHMDAGSKTERALNLIMLYETDPGNCMGELPNYLTSERMVDDYMLLFASMGISSDTHLTLDMLEDGLIYYEKQDHYDERVGSFIRRFIDLKRKVSILPEEAEEPEDNSLEGNNLKLAFADFLKSQFSNYQVLELRIPRDLRHSPRENTLALLRIVEFINRSVEPKIGDMLPPSLSDRCLENWKAVEQDTDLELKYSDMLYVYEQTLRTIKLQLETDSVPSVRGARSLPNVGEMKDEIGDPGSKFEKSHGKDADDPDGLIKVLERFRRKRLSASNARKDWYQTRNLLEVRLEDLEGTLKRYAGTLSRQYSARIEARKKETLSWKDKLYFADGKTEDQIAELERIRDACLAKLREPNMTPSLRFEDQTNVESALIKANVDITHYLNCLEAVTALNFLTVFGTVLAGVVLHYSALQPFVFRDGISLLTYLIYNVAVAVGLGLMWLAPYAYCARGIKKAVGTLQTQLNQYLPDYTKRGMQFREYINTLNRLDSVTKYLALYRDAVDASRRLHQGCLWHRTQIGDHLKKVGAFRGLIDIGSGRMRTKTFEEGKCSAADLLDGDGKISPIEKCSLYWPQGGDTL